MKIAKIGKLDVTNLQWLLHKNPQLWDQNTARTSPENSPHHGLSDIWARFAPPGVDGNSAHDSVWYDSPLTEELKRMSAVLTNLVSGTELGGVLITKIPPGGECKPHKDPGWHARYYEKIAVQVAALPGQEFMFHGHALATRPGDIFWFDNAHEHWVTNPTIGVRITAIFCIKTKVFDALKET